MTLKNILFMFVPYKTDKKVKERARMAWDFAATAMEIKKPGKHPPVTLTDRTWPILGTSCRARGRYQDWKVFKWVLKDRVEIVDEDSYMMSNLVHEFVHSLMARNGIKMGEVLPEDIETMARMEFKE